MRAKTLEERITRRNRKTLASALTVGSHVFPIASALIAVFMMASLYSMQEKNKTLPLIGIDLMGSDENSSTLLESLLPILESLKHSAKFVLFGDEKNKEKCNSYPFISYVSCSEFIKMDEDPLLAIRRKKQSSLHIGMLALKNKQIQAFISPGSTGALMACARLHLDMLRSISRPALLTLLPTKKNHMAVLDVGASSGCKSIHLIEFAAIGIAYQKARGIQNPKVGLLNIGREAKKGPPELQKAHHHLSSYAFFEGNIEGRDAFEGWIDVLVTDGFTGNIFLKTSEGIARFFLDQLSHYRQTESLKSRLDYNEYPGALLAGVNGLVIKCHGTGASSSFCHSLISTITLIESDFLGTLNKELAFFFKEN